MLSGMLGCMLVVRTFGLVAATLFVAVGLRADERVSRLTSRLAREAAALQQHAGELAAREVLRQRTFRARPGNSSESGDSKLVADRQREIISRYALSTVGGQIREIRQILSVDGKSLKGDAQARQLLARALQSNSDQIRRDALEQWKKAGLASGVTDFGQFLLLFTTTGVERFEFSALGQRYLDDIPVFAFRYRQLDGSAGVHVVPQGGRQESLPMQGEIWVGIPDGTPRRITVTASSVDAKGDLVTQFASIDYASSPADCLFPSRVRHRETRNGRVTAENDFDYESVEIVGRAAGVLH